MLPGSPRETIEDDYLDLPSGGASEELESEVRRAKAELDELRRKQEQIEKEKQRLEELSRRQEALEAGKEDMIERLSNSLALISREIEEGEQRVEQLRLIHRNFSEHLAVLQTIQPKTWSAAEAGKELTKGQAALDEARSEFQKAQARFAIEAPEIHSAEDAGYEEPAGEKDFAYWLRSGFAFTLPLQVLGIIGLLLWLWTNFSQQ